MLDINLKQLEAFVATAETCSFTQAAGTLYLTQSTISAHVGSLERTLGAKLIQRGARQPVALTERGRQVYEEAKDILARCRALQEGPSGGGDWQIRIGASTVPGQYLLPELMSGFHSRHPQSQYIVSRGDSTRIHRLLAQKRVRIGFVGAAMDRQGCIYHAIAEDRLVLITANREPYRSLHGRNAPGRTLLDQPIILREPTSGTRQATENYLRRCGIGRDSLRLVAEIDDPEAVKSSVIRGIGVSIISNLSVREELAAEKLLSFDLDAGGAYRSIYLAWRKDASLTAAELSFTDYVLSSVSKSPNEKPGGKSYE